MATNEWIDSSANMVHLLISMMISIICLRQTVLTLTVRKFVYQKDMSEYCKRRVVPSVFLGRHVEEAHSQILHFSRMELPYSCFISVRSESGSNIVLVVQLLSDESLVNACAESPSQLLVYEMGETFGGYWGPLPDSVVRPEPTQHEVHTRKTTQPYYTRNKADLFTRTEMQVPNKTHLSFLKPATREKEKDFIRIEVPLVNVSGRLVAERGPLQSSYDVDDLFDLLYDVTPRAKQQYDTSILPVVQFSIGKHEGGRRGEGFRYDLELEYESDGRFTIDERLPFSQYSERTTRRNSYRTNFYVNRLLNFKKTSDSHQLTEHTTQHYQNRNIQESSAFSTNFDSVYNTSPDTGLYMSPITSRIGNAKSWEEIEEILQKSNKSSSITYKYDNYKNNITSILDTISNMKHNRSVYLLPKWDSFIDEHQQKNPVINAITKRFGTFTRKPLASFNYATKIIRQFQKSTKSRMQKALLVSIIKSTTNSAIKHNSKDEVSKSTNDNEMNTTVSRLNKNNITVRNVQNAAQAPSIVPEPITVHKITQSITMETISAYAKPVTGSLVDHESWENVVQAAPVMAKLLNQTAPEKRVNNTTHNASDNVTNHDVIRIKRKIQPIPIDNARPHNLTTKTAIATTTVGSYGISDMQEFAQLVELQDDELHERVALRYLRQYAGPMLFNICNYGEPNARQVYLFNSSRIVLAIHNFTLEKMSVMLTPARTLLSGVSRCSSSTLECQVYGTRICIDSMNACDGVPNCGAYDIYDEDRLMCGAAAGLQHNVYLAAITLLAVLLTIIYTVYYWLRRCVPKVSEAFFIYTDGAENILYLETIMRSPHDIYDGSKVAYHAHLFDEDDYMSPDGAGKFHRNIFYRIIRACFKCCKYRRKEKKLSDEIKGEPPCMGPRKVYSFAELELSKMIHQKRITDTAVQTGDSLELSQAELKKKGFQFKPLPERAIDNRRMAKAAVISDDDIPIHVNELNTLKFFKEFNSDHILSPSLATAISGASEIIEVSETIEKLVDKPSFEEEELQSHFYDRDRSVNEVPGTSHILITTTCDIHSEKPITSKQAKKHLRFEEDTPRASSVIEEDEEEDYDEIKDSVDPKKKDHNADSNVHSTGVGRDFKRFWKGKKSKKKAHLALY